MLKGKTGESIKNYSYKNNKKEKILICNKKIIFSQYILHQLDNSEVNSLNNIVINIIIFNKINFGKANKLTLIRHI